MWRALIIVLFLAASPAQALEEGDKAAIQTLITRQIEAFGKDDAAGAYSAAAPGIQRMFPDQERFMAMVRDGYKPVFRQRSYSFGTAEDSPAGPLQAVRIQDDAGVDWLALYSLERQADGTWRISGCTLVRQPGQAV